MTGREGSGPGIVPEALRRMEEAVRQARRGERASVREAVTELLATLPEAPSLSVPLRLTVARLRVVLRDFEGALSLLAETGADPAIGTGAAADAVRAAVFDWTFEICRRLGFYREALSAFREAVRLDPGRAARWEAGARLLFESYADEMSLEWFRRGIALEPGSTNLRMRTAHVLARLGRVEELRLELDRALEGVPPTASLHLAAAGLLGSVMEADAALRHLERATAIGSPAERAEAHAGRAQWALWRGEWEVAAEQVEAALTAAPDLAVAHRQRAALAVLRGDGETALRLTAEAAERAPRDPEVWIWRGEALLRQGRPEEAFESLNRGGELTEDTGDFLAMQLLRLLALAAMGKFPGIPEYVVAQSIEIVRPGEVKRLDPSDVPGTVALIERTLTAMRGNRSWTPTFVREHPGEAEERREELLPIRVATSPRAPCKEALWQFRLFGRSAAERAFEAIHAAYPGAPEPHCYHGELFLYLGDYVTARQHFEQALRFYERTRWAFIGLGAVELMEGNPERALEVLAEGVRLSGAPGPTTYIYRGEALRRLGRHEEAVEDLEFIARQTPTRFSAWINLALSRAALGDSDFGAAVIDRLAEQAAGLLADGGRETGIDVNRPGAAVPVEERQRLFEHLLVMMRGNRGSSALTWLTRDGKLRVVPPVPLVQRQSDAADLERIEEQLQQLRARIERGGAPRRRPASA